MAFEVGHFIELLERIAPISLAESWDNPGLQVGATGMPVNRVFVSLDPTLKAVRLALKADAQLLFTHHPLIFKPISRVETTSYPGDVISEALRGGLAIVSAHTNLDAAKGGINDILADLLGLKNVSVLSPAADSEQVGLGRIGDLPEPISLDTFADTVRGLLGPIRSLTRPAATQRPIRRVGVVGGSGGSLAEPAHRKGAEVLLTGDVGHHTALTAQSLGLVLLDAGHFKTEKVAFTAFSEQLAAECAGQGWSVPFETDISETDPLTD